jgi:hypothetical protein
VDDKIYHHTQAFIYVSTIHPRCIFSIILLPYVALPLYHLSWLFYNKLNAVEDEAKKTWERNGKWEKWVGETVTGGNKRRGDIDRCVDKASESLKEGKIKYCQRWNVPSPPLIVSSIRGF